MGRSRVVVVVFFFFFFLSFFLSFLVIDTDGRGGWNAADRRQTCAVGSTSESGLQGTATWG